MWGNGNYINFQRVHDKKTIWLGFSPLIGYGVMVGELQLVG